MTGPQSLRGDSRPHADTRALADKARATPRALPLPGTHLHLGGVESGWLFYAQPQCNPRLRRLSRGPAVSGTAAAASRDVCLARTTEVAHRVEMCFRK
ncbi:unnamed protein product [Lampetra fluviatilis]